MRTYSYTTMTEQSDDVMLPACGRFERQTRARCVAASNVLTALGLCSLVLSSGEKRVRHTPSPTPEQLVECIIVRRHRNPNAPLPPVLFRQYEGGNNPLTHPL